MSPSYNEFLNTIKLKTVSCNTVNRWMNFLGYGYDKHKKLYYTDGHERKDVVNDVNISQ